MPATTTCRIVVATLRVVMMAPRRRWSRLHGGGATLAVAAVVIAAAFSQLASESAGRSVLVQVVRPAAATISLIAVKDLADVHLAKSASVAGVASNDASQITGSLDLDPRRRGVYLGTNGVSELWPWTSALSSTSLTESSTATVLAVPLITPRSDGTTPGTSARGGPTRPSDEYDHAESIFRLVAMTVLIAALLTAFVGGAALLVAKRKKQPAERLHA